ncbi:GDSL-type esterase/lipase family protein [uncultured Thiodictyon sp.]|uniref:GDSL-type esterase/lipase family protein n=1 Tax=uncultured Thiodictyon sp. TaxID=1846217 RepID=UPI0025F80A85|nr:GDSL-type esterase/lipase family protein [uncultured Thiodictyon sp.]
MNPSPAGAYAQNSAINAAPRADDWWKARHQSMSDRVKMGDVDMIFIGDCIMQGWSAYGKAVWDKFYANRKALNLGISGDHTQHVLWRLDNGNIDGISPKLAVLMIGTNNADSHKPEEIAAGVTAIVKTLRDKLSNTKILLLAILPREEKPGELRAKLDTVNGLIAKLADGKMVRFLDIGPKFLEAGGVMRRSIIPDALHPNEKGYEIWAQAIEASVAEMLGEIEASESVPGTSSDSES